LKHVKLLKAQAGPRRKVAIFTQNAQLLITIKAFSLVFMSIKIFKNLNHFSHGMHHSTYQWSLFVYVYDPKVQQNSTSPDAGYSDRLGSSGRSVENSTKLTVIGWSTVQCCGF